MYNSNNHFIMQPSKKVSKIQINKEISAETLVENPEVEAKRNPVNKAYADIMMLPGRKQSSITLNPDLAVEPKQESNRPQKQVHTDPRCRMKKSGSGKGNWGSIKDEITDPIEDWTKVTQSWGFKLRADNIALTKMKERKEIQPVQLPKWKKSLFDATKEAFGGEATRFGSMIGLFSFIWKTVSNSLAYIEGKHTKRQGAIAGFLAGLAILCETKENRIGYTQQFFMRSMQAGKNALKQRKFPTVPHGDTLLFSFACAQILYSYAFRPLTLPKEYYSFMIKTARVPKQSLVTQAAHIRKLESIGEYNVGDTFTKTMKELGATKGNMQRLQDYLTKFNGKMPGIPCLIYHPKEDSCISCSAKKWYQVFMQMTPVYLSLNIVPVLVLKTKHFLQNPSKYLSQSFQSVLFSGTFIASYISSFQAGMCLFCNLFPSTNPKYLVYAMGAISGFTILLEQKPKRAELAMYCLPKAIQSLYEILIDKGRIIHVPHLDILGSCISWSVIMSLYQKEPHQISSILYKILRALVGTY
ncbi:hypothetical protein HDV01_005374 [Terramyces sp. JEL0728]|nr:hypothetical protein HDV01_005374 [Terramyces sp. JEL0728]